MLKGLFDIDGKLYSFLSKFTDMVIVTILWIIGSLPVVTFIASTASMYHTIVKCIRSDGGSVWAEFWKAYKMNLRQGIVLMVIYGCLGALLLFTDYWCFVKGDLQSGVSSSMALGLLVLNLVFWMNFIWLIPLFSRFSLPTTNLMKLTYVLSIKKILPGIPMLLILILAVFLFFVWTGLWFILPALVLFGCSYLAEPTLKKYESILNDAENTAPQ